MEINVESKTQENKGTFSMDKNELENLIFGLNSTLDKLCDGSNIRITIDSEEGTISTYVIPSGDYSFKIPY